MRKCSIVICPKPAKWEGTLGIPGEPKFDRKVQYCDEHSWTQVNSVPDTMKLTLTPIGQEAKS